MKVAFYASDKPREQILAEAFRRGCIAIGDECEIIPNNDDRPASGFDVAAMFGVKSRHIYQANRRAGVNLVMIDKGYCRHRVAGPDRLWEYWRVAVNGHHPTRYLMREDRPPDRLSRIGLEPAPSRKGKHILIAGSSAKYHAFYGLDDPTAWAGQLVFRLRQITDRQIIYRPKPSWRDALPIPGTHFSPPQEPLANVLQGAHCLITHGSNACFEAVLAGVPVIVLGDGVAKPIAETDIARVENPFRPTEKQVNQWLRNLAYCQWTLAEFESGAAWREIRREMEDAE